MNKTLYNQVSKIINETLTKYDDGNFKPRVSVAETSDVDPKFCDTWSLAINNDAYDLIHNHKGKAQDMFFSDEIYVVGDYDLYIEPYNSWLFNLARI